ncbi:MAG: DNA repair ATPase, partial [Bacteroidota bacterium]
MKEKTAHTTPTENTPQLEGGTYEIIRSRLSNQAKGLRERMEELNQARKEVFGTVETQLLANDRITTSNNCIPQDMVAIGHHFLFAYNVHIGLRTEIKMEDVFSAYRFEGKDHSFHEEALDLLADAQFHEDFHNLYKYYKDTVFAKFALIGPHLFMVFQVGKNTSDIKTFKWAIGEDKLTYLGNRFDHEFRYPAQHEFSWKRTSREMHRRGTHPHVSIEDRLFVETVGGDLTIKVEDNTDSGLGIYQEPVEHQEQTLDDADIYYADLGNLVLLKVRPYQEKEWRYLIFNEKMQEVLRVDALEEACVRLPDEQGIIFSNGYYLQTGNYKIFDKVLADLHFEKRIVSPNGEDFLYVFFQPLSGEYVLLPYNLVAQEVDTPIICHGFTIFPNGELCYFRAESEPGRHHVVQVWQTPYGQTSQVPNGKADTYLYKVGNKDLVRGMAECNEVLTLLNREDSYGNLYIDLVKKTGDVVDSYYWINHADAFTLSEPLNAIRETAASAIDEFEKVRRIKKNTAESFSTTARNLEDLLDKIKRKKPQKIEQFVGYLSDLRALKGEIIALKDLRYADLAKVEEFEEAVNGHSQEMSEACVNFLLKEDALQPYVAQVEELDQAVGSITKVAEADEVGSRIDETGRQLELLIEVVGNLKIEDATQTTAIIDRISTIYASLNTLRAQLKKARKDLQGTEATAEFAAQLKLLNQGLINYIDLCDSPEKCEEYLTKLMVQLEELEGKFVDFDQFITELGEKREEIYAAFETRRLALLEARNKRSQ